MKVDYFYELIYRSFLGLWLFMMLAFSGDFTNFKLIILVVLLSLTLFELTQFRVNYSLKSYAVLLIWLFLVTFSYLHGLVIGFKFSFSLLFYTVLTPIICFLLAARINSARLKFVNSILIISLGFILFLSFYYIGFRLGFYSIPAWMLEMRAFGGIKITDEQLEIRLASQSSLIFLLPYIATLLFFGKKRLLYTTFLIVGLIVVIFSGRRALQILFFLGLICSAVIYAYESRMSISSLFRLLLASVFFIFCMSIIFDIISMFTDLKNPLATFINTILLSFDSSKGGGVERQEQAYALFNFFAESPFFGSGLNSHPQYTRNASEPWSYEWVYLALLAQGGLILFSFFLLVCFLILYSNFIKGRELFECDSGMVFYAILTGGICFIIAGSTNPMIYFSWFWFLCFISFNGLCDE
ncbi:hypothetical protein [Photobacterium indicum]|uniref:Polysaccharide polymerase n=1 Tax=Photobacterium indicum TaxID=81447 RepID=A0A2T3L7W9_9GAMM|nr:hypothetical protein [Photobacterium indicum]PSV46782.1 hypothetical protein C9J47_13400 [Photobacterium indicum]